jgi:hypothetical protein
MNLSILQGMSQAFYINTFLVSVTTNYTNFQAKKFDSCLKYPALQPNLFMKRKNLDFGEQRISRMNLFLTLSSSCARIRHDESGV